jgi:hypothetical protein
VPPDRAFFSAIFYNQYHLSPIVSVLSMRFAIMSCNGGGPICCRTGMPPTVMVDERSTYGPLYANSWQKFILQTQLLDPRPMAYYLVLRAHNMAYAAYMDWIKLMCEPALSVYSKFHPRFPLWEKIVGESTLRHLNANRDLHAGLIRSVVSVIRRWNDGSFASRERNSKI